MAASANTVWECRATATAGNVNGGGFVTGASGTDYSQQDAAQYALTGVTSSGAGNTFLTASAASDMVGNFARVVSGTNFTVGWFEITSVSVGVSVTCATNAAGASICTGVGSSGVINIGGALSLGSTFDDDVCEEFVGGNTCWIKAGSYTLGESISIGSTSATGTAPIIVSGYSTTRGDNPSIISGNQPIIAMGANSFDLAQYWIVRYITFTTTSAGGVSVALGAILQQIKCTNTSTTANRAALTVNQRGLIVNCEAVSQNGRAITLSSSSQVIYGCYIHDSVTGINFATNTSSVVIDRCIINSCSSSGISITTNTTGNNKVINCSIRGSNAKIGIGIEITGSDSPLNQFINTILTGLATGISKSTTNQLSNMDLLCDYYNNTADTSNFTKSNTALAVDPGFRDVAEITGSTATTSGSVLTQSGGDFSTVEDNVDFLRVTSGTGVTTGIYLITSHTATTVTVNNTLGTSSAGDVVYTIPTGHDFRIGSALRGIGAPLFFGSATTDSLDIGATQSVNKTLSAPFLG